MTSQTIPGPRTGHVGCAPGCSPGCGCRADELPFDPYLALRATYGMLLGEDDFTVLAANPRGKLMLHQAWLHGPGVVWGLGVCFDPDDERPQLRVAPGLALDGLGRELHLDTDHCLDLRCWVDQGPEPDWEHDENGGCHRAVLSRWLVARFDSYQTCPVPALADPCDPSRSCTESSRIFETVAFDLAEEAPVPCLGRDGETDAFHGVRVLLGLSEPIDAADHLGHEAVRRRQEAANEETWKRAPALLEAFRHLAAHDVLQLEPCRADGDACAAWFPESEQEPMLLLAKVDLQLTRVDDCVTVAGADIDPYVRSALLPTNLIQELTCGLAPGLIGGETIPDAGGPRVIPESVQWLDESSFRLQVTETLMEGSLNRGSISVTTVSPQAGWNVVDVRLIVYDESSRTVEVHLYDRPTFPYVRVVVRGTGPTPVLGDDLVPLAGVVGGLPGTRARGHDADLTILPEVWI